MTAVAPVLQSFFTERLMTQRKASPHTITAYRDAFRLLLGFASDHTAIKPNALDLADLDAPFISAFLDHLEHERGNSIRTRNARLAAIHSLFNYAALRHPEHAASIKRVLAIPPKRYERNLLTYLTDPEADALLAACDRTTWTGRRDHAMLALTLQTGLRVSELTALTLADLHLGDGPNVHCVGKGRKERRTPLLPATVAVMRVWLDERQGHGHEPLFSTSTGRHLSRDAVERRITLYSGRAAERCPSITAKHPTAHTLRHTAAMRLLLSGVDVTVIALWLGHEQVGTVQHYLHADMTQKERAIAKTTPPGTKPGRYHAPDPLLAFLEAL
ncbi:site-specific integrase [Nonomuraea sp. K274]|uniref:Site-specific integrase n=1 Tax=Nonomuraea cypriaca TaxID=1187855 RepID=A0A931EXI3_9ACTN|nr:tyrosine-type recombinase/integrase [Nonomuraea cypriaca]MBF8185512.1 site-specific integrase [Nonomuraea cypriaca]